jgi:hypothetical protein
MDRANSFGKIDIGIERADSVPMGDPLKNIPLLRNHARGAKMATHYPYLPSCTKVGCFFFE